MIEESRRAWQKFDEEVKQIEGKSFMNRFINEAPLERQIPVKKQTSEKDGKIAEKVTENEKMKNQTNGESFVGKFMNESLEKQIPVEKPTPKKDEKFEEKSIIDRFLNEMAASESLEKQSSKKDEKVAQVKEKSTEKSVEKEPIFKMPIFTPMKLVRFPSLFSDERKILTTDDNIMKVKSVLHTISMKYPKNNLFSKGQ